MGLGILGLRGRLLKALMFASDCANRLSILRRPPVRVARIFANRSYGSHRQQRLDVILPAGHPPYPSMVFVHGGGWVAGDKSVYDPICRSFAEAGYCVVNVNYRLGPGRGWPMPVQDVADAVNWVCERGIQYGADPSALFLAGDSAGAHLVSWYAAALTRPELLAGANVRGLPPGAVVRGLLLFYGVYDLGALLRSDRPFIRTMVRTLLACPEPQIAERAAAASPLAHVGPGMVPCMVSAANVDALSSQSVWLVERLAAHGVPCRKLFLSREAYPDARHGFLFLHWTKGALDALRASVEFMQDLLADAPLRQA